MRMGESDGRACWPQYGWPCRWATLFTLLACVVLLLLFAGCGGIQTVTETQTRTVTNKVDVPVPVACVSRADVPKLPVPTTIDIAKARTDQKAAATAADVEQFERYARAAAALIEHCIQTGGGK